MSKPLELTLAHEDQLRAQTRIDFPELWELNPGGPTLEGGQDERWVTFHHGNNSPEQARAMRSVVVHYVFRRIGDEWKWVVQED